MKCRRTGLQLARPTCWVIPGSCHDVGVGDGVGDGDVAVHADHHQVQDGGGAGPHVHRQPQEAEVPPEYPTLHHLQCFGSGRSVLYSVDTKHNYIFCCFCLGDLFVIVLCQVSSDRKKNE